MTETTTKTISIEAIRKALKTKGKVYIVVPADADHDNKERIWGARMAGHRFQVQVLRNGKLRWMNNARMSDVRIGE